MRKILFFLFVCWGTIGMGVAQEQVKISRFQGERVTGLDISGAFDITIRQGEDTGVTLSIPSHYEDNLVFENWGGTVKVGFKGRIKKHAKNEKFNNLRNKCRKYSGCKGFIPCVYYFFNHQILLSYCNVLFQYSIRINNL